LGETIIFHLDIDAFFASAEVLDHPEYQGLPLIVGGDPQGRGVVSTCNYEARKYGIHSAMPSFKAYQLCPQGIFVFPRMKRYQELSLQVMNILRSSCPEVHQVSIDEAYLNMSGTRRLLGPPHEVGKDLKNKIKRETGLTVSIGIAPNRFLAKIASDFRKPNGLYAVEPEKVIPFLDQIPLGKIPGLGQKTLARLRELGITTVPMLRQVPEGELCALLGQAAGRFLYKASRGEQEEQNLFKPRTHSLSTEKTLAEDTQSTQVLHKVLLELCSQIMFRMNEEHWLGKTPFLKLKFEDFKSVTVQKTLTHYVSSSLELNNILLVLLHEKWKGSPKIRLLGVGFQDLEKADGFQQGELFQDEDQRKQKVEKSVFRMKNKFPDLPLTKASLLKPQILQQGNKVEKPSFPEAESFEKNQKDFSEP